jgi:hypothetical protein
LADSSDQWTLSWTFAMNLSTALYDGRHIEKCYLDCCPMFMSC